MFQTLDVKVSGHRVGFLDRAREGMVRFVPDPAWLEGGMFPRLGYAFLADSSVRAAASGLPAWFENLLPEQGSALRSRVAREFGLRPGQSAALLHALGRVLPGAVEVIGEVGAFEEEELRAAALPPGLWKVSLAGMQLKLSMVRSSAGFSLPAHSERGDWILKLPGARFPDLPAVEAATLAWAKHLGHEVPEVLTPPLEALEGLPQDLREGPPQVFAIRRFDRLEDGRRVHQEDFAQVLEVPPEHKYGHSGPYKTSYDRLGTLVLDAGGLEQAHEFVRRLAFVVGAGVGDAHLKNWSFQWLEGEARPRLSPCYDLVSDVSFLEFGWANSRKPTLALALGRSRALGRLRLEHLRTFQERSRIPDAEAIFMDALARIREGFRALEGDFPSSMRRALPVHWEAVPLLRRLGSL